MASAKRRIARGAELAACVALWLLSPAGVAAAGGWGTWDLQQHQQAGAAAARAAAPRSVATLTASGNLWGQDLGVPGYEGDHQPVPYARGNTILGDSTLNVKDISFPHQASPRSSFFPVVGNALHGFQHVDTAAPAQQHQQQHMTLADFPIEVESQHTDAMGLGVENVRRGLQLDAKGSLLQVFVNFFKKPRLFKLLVFAAVMLTTFFFVGIFARIAQFVFGIWAALKVLQLLEEDDVPGKGPNPTQFSNARHPAHTME
ncbi:hypothetical protein, conserved [Eimeria maxima]|uniref:Uncharacterized protein n=1 Tax=Eimeria maxima TaxID=5804 RepID=U6M2V7_EIMMA|nr:hypothetical protein, conserved [Eimeria maxima]CDJ58361.1 hypothetical protein, conserved [Eimeria maxima]